MIKFSLPILSLLALTLLASPVGAEQPPADQGGVPPTVDDRDAEVTIIHQKERVIEEYRINGVLYKVKITPVVGKPYYIFFPEGPPSDLGGPNPAYWKLFEW